MDAHDDSYAFMNNEEPFVCFSLRLSPYVHDTNDITRWDNVFHMIKPFDHYTYKLVPISFSFSHTYLWCPCDESHYVWPDDWLTMVILRGPRGCISPSFGGVSTILEWSRLYLKSNRYDPLLRWTIDDNKSMIVKCAVTRCSHGIGT